MPFFHSMHEELILLNSRERFKKSSEICRKSFIQAPINFVNISFQIIHYLTHGFVFSNEKNVFKIQMKYFKTLLIFISFDLIIIFLYNILSLTPTL